MPRFLEDQLRREYSKKGKKGRDLDNAIFGTMNKIGAMHGNQPTPKGEAMQRKHDADMRKK